MRSPSSYTQAVLIGLFAAAAAGCDDGVQRRQEADLHAAQARVDPPELWSVQVVGEAHNGRPVLICADRQLRSGFTSVIPARDIEHCSRIGPVTATRDGQSYRCSLGARVYQVASEVRGDLKHDFMTSFSVHAIGGVGYARTLRFHRLRRCPLDWNVGETTDQLGQRRR